MNRTSLKARLTGLLGLTLILVLAGACQRIAPIRTLPSWVRGVYIPVFKNKTVEPEVEELATRLAQEAFLNDGRVDIVPKTQADLTLVAEIVGWERKAGRTSSDHIAYTDDITVVASVKLYEPFDMKTPLADLGLIRASMPFRVDTRSVGFEPEPDRKEDLFRSLAGVIVGKVITGFPANLRDLPPGASVPNVRTPQSIQPDDVLAPKSTSDMSIQQH